MHGLLSTFAKPISESFPESIPLSQWLFVHDEH